MWAGWGIAAAIVVAPASADLPLRTRAPTLPTRWSAGVSTVAPLPEYPRPQLRRPDWENLNGRWQYERAVPGQPPPVGRYLGETVLVPFPVQSALSGIGRKDTTGWYRRLFQIPRGWGTRHVVLNFGAVSWLAGVWVNGQFVGAHRGDYSGFSFDITPEVRRTGSNELLVGYLNPIGAAGEPVGKQSAGLGGLFHTASSGIWQTVWLEPVAPAHVTGLALHPDVRRGRLLVSAATAGHGRLRLRVQALAGRRVVASAGGIPGAALAVPIPHEQLWSPSSPYLYGLTVELLDRTRVVDRVSSYFGMRSITLARVAGRTRILLNGQFLFQTGALDQGFWPDGLYTAPSDPALRFDLEAARRLGFNMVRKHAKVEPDRWYMWADRLGVLVWQDIPSMPINTPHPPTGPAQAEFRRELGEIVDQRRSHPSIVTWVPFNEGWQQFALGPVTAQLKRLDRWALVDTNSGSANCCAALDSPASDLHDTHLYPGPFAVPSDRRATAVGEYGALLPFPPAAHRWPGSPTSLGSSAASWPRAYIVGILRRQYAMLALEAREGGLSAAVFTELTAQESELGILSYDRAVFTLPPALLQRLNASVLAAGTAGVAVPVRRPRRAAVPLGTTGLWKFDRGRGPVAVDSSGHHHSLTLQPGAGWTHGVHGAALALGVPGAVALARAAVVDPRHSFTVSAWLKSRQIGESGSAVSEPGPDGSSFSLGIETAGRSLQTRPGELASGVLPPALRTWWTFAASKSRNCSPLLCIARANMHYDDGRLSPRPGRWHYVTGVFDGATQTASVFVDGAPQDVEHASAPPRARGPLMVGRGNLIYAPVDTFTGAVDELRTYARALSPDEVWALYQAER